VTENLDDLRPLYVCVADGIREAIEKGEYGVGDKLPSYSQLAESHSVSHMTVKQAIASLKLDGTVVSRQGMGVFVRSATPRTPDPRSQLEELRSRVDELEQRVHAIEQAEG
jgi:DNA-binding GntR family transcriptional regulator